MIPPPRQIDSKLQINYTAPIEKWVQLRLFDSRSECEAARSAYAKNPPGGIADMLSSKAKERAVMQAARCIAASDPGIAEQSSAARSVRPLASNPQRAHPRRQRARIHAEQFRAAPRLPEIFQRACSRAATMFSRSRRTRSADFMIPDGAALL
jgi:hypothetical protein